MIRDHRDRVNNLAFSPNGEWLITGSWDRRVKLWRWRPLVRSQTDRFLYYRDFVTPRHNIGPENEVYAVAYSSHDLIAAASGDHTIYIWNRDGKPFTRIRNAHGARIFSLDFSPTHPHLLASGGADNQIRLWFLKPVGAAWQLPSSQNNPNGAQRRSSCSGLLPDRDAVSLRQR